jgi:dTDP-glucose pyrophosphorylase
VWGIIPAAGKGSRIQPLAFSKELLPVGSRDDGDVERPRAASEYLVERMLCAGAEKICFVISAGKSDILEYYGGAIGGATICYAVQPRPAGLCDAIFRARPFIQPEESVVVGLPDTIWFPVDGLRALPDDRLAFLLFPVDRPELFDAVLLEPEGGSQGELLGAPHGAVRTIVVKQPSPGTEWVWGAFRLPGAVLHQLYELWVERHEADEYIGSLVNAYLAAGGLAVGVRAGEAYVDVGTLHGYREALHLLESRAAQERSRLTSPPAALAPLGSA